MLAVFVYVYLLMGAHTLYTLSVQTRNKHLMEVRVSDFVSVRLHDGEDGIAMVLAMWTTTPEEGGEETTGMLRVKWMYRWSDECIEHWRRSVTVSAAHRPNSCHAHPMASDNMQCTCF